MGEAWLSQEEKCTGQEWGVTLLPAPGWGRIFNAKWLLLITVGLETAQSSLPE